MPLKVPFIRLRGIRQIIPSGYFLGRTNRGDGDVELIPAKTLGNALVAAGGVSGPGAIGTATNPAYELLGFAAGGPFAVHQQFDLSMAPRKVLFPSAKSPGTLDKAICQFAPTSNISFVLTFDRADYLAHGTSVLATIAFLAGQKTGTITWGTPRTVLFADVLWVIMPGTADPTFAEIQCLFGGDPK
jgi:hypothetical protein